MSDIIRRLPDHVANQIAAGEVVQRPASVVKELLENAIDANATSVELIVKDAGRTLIQVVDNGKGMSFSDARLCFERHATSKITSAQDLFSLQTKGFRGEALASIAAIAHVEMKTKQNEAETGTKIVIEGSDVKEHTLDVSPNGTSFAVKNLFFNVPARRNFLKSDNVEFSHVEEEFNRVALIHHQVAFKLYHNDKLLLNLPATNFKQRICAIFGADKNNKIFPVDQTTDEIMIKGFISKPENTKKKKNSQYIFVNQRFVSHYLLRFAIEKVYQELIPDGNKPAFFIQIEIDPAKVDFNISPTKTEVKFQDDKVLFGFLNAAVRKSIGSLSLHSKIDFDDFNQLDVIEDRGDRVIAQPTIQRDPTFNPFNLVPAQQRSSSSSHSNSGAYITKPSSVGNNDFAKWNQMLDDVQRESVELSSAMNNDDHCQLQPLFEAQSSELPDPETPFFCVKGNFIVTKKNDEVVMINNELAWERILFERYADALENAPITIQQTMFPETITLTPANAELAVELRHDFLLLGYELEQVNHTQFCINGMPMNETISNAEEEINAIIENYKSNQFLYKADKHKNMARSIAKQKKNRYQVPNTQAEFASLMEQLSACKISQYSMDGHPIVLILL